MKIAVVNEVSACLKNKDIVAALEQAADAEILNIGMGSPTEEPELTYIHISYISAVLLNGGICDFVVGGCGTGQGYLNAVMQFPNVFCGLIGDPLDAWLFSQINGGNCISLPLNKGYGWAADLNLKYIFEKLFADPVGQGYPLYRAQSQAASRNILRDMSVSAHFGLAEILRKTDRTILQTIMKNVTFAEAVRGAGQIDPGVKEILLNI